MAMVVATGVLTLLVLLAVFVAHVPVTGAQIARVVSVERAGRAAVLRAGPAARHAGERPGRAGGHQHAVPADGLPLGPVVPGHEPAQGDAVDRARASELPPQCARAGCGGHRRRSIRGRTSRSWRPSPSACCGSPRGACARSASIRAMNTRRRRAHPAPHRALPRALRVRARAGLGDRRSHPPGQVAVDRRRPPALVDVGVRHPDVRAGLHVEVGRADGGVVSGVHRVVCEDAAVLAPRVRSLRLRHGGAVLRAAALVSLGHQLLRLRLRDAARGQAASRDPDVPAAMVRAQRACMQGSRRRSAIRGR